MRIFNAEEPSLENGGTGGFVADSREKSGLDMTGKATGCRFGQPRVSVLTPIYRTEPELLRQTIRGVLEQTFRDFEFILLDDCPEDPRESVVREFEDPRVLYRKNERNLGISESRNRLIDFARGEYLAVLDHDDICRRDRLEKEVAYLDSHPDCGVVSSWTREIPSNRLFRRSEDDTDLRLELMGGNVVPHSAMMLRASVLHEHGIRYESEYSPSEDYMLCARLLGVTRFHNIPEPLLDYRLYAGNTSKLHAVRMFRSGIRVRAFAKVSYPELYEAYVRTVRQVTDIRFLGVPVLRIETIDNRTVAKLFCAIPFISVKRGKRHLAGRTAP